MGIYVIDGNGDGDQILSAEEIAVLRMENLVVYADFNDTDTMTFDSSNRVSRINSKTHNEAYFTPGLTPTGSLMTITDIGSDGQRGMLCASNRSVMVSDGNIFAAGGGFSAMSIVQQTVGSDGFFISSGEVSNGVSGGPFTAGFLSSNQFRAYAQYSVNPKIPTGFTNDGGICCILTLYDAATSTIHCIQDGVLRQSISGFGPLALTDLRAVLNGFVSGASYTGFVDGTVNLHVLVNEFFAPSSDEAAALMDLARSRFPTEAWPAL